MPDEAMARLFEAVPSNDLPEVPRYNVCPTQAVHTVVSEGGTRRLRPMRWGFLPHWYKTPTDGPLLINARAETVADKPAFRKACRERRCLVPATGFFEWTKDEDGKRLPWHIYRADNAPIAFAGIWQTWERGEDAFVTCAIVTTGANEAMKQIHHRMPVSIEPADWSLWLGEAGTGAALLMQAPPDETFAFHRVDPAVNSNRAQGPQLLEPL